jgi:DNA-binding FadR family transcriptional regulator
MNKLIFGNRLPTETQHAETFGVSNLGILEATKALEFRCIIENKAEWLIEMDPLSPG